ncbi:hypothetical protein [Haloarcula marismortui]|uniref:Uncharacterized protein n=1 Tax=Haloarcula marismortui ATCC 33800 TaxID=662476 RepID=A0A8T8KJD3_9EURY|nr:hypothetical protein [Haloarcula sinaiiensis]QUJ74007.1 hypothetical protein KDQ40_18740 [Haloarcula sinaiiensis ATCC 33800]
MSGTSNNQKDQENPPEEDELLEPEKAADLRKELRQKDLDRGSFTPVKKGPVIGMVKQAARETAHHCLNDIVRFARSDLPHNREENPLPESPPTWLQSISEVFYLVILGVLLTLSAMIFHSSGLPELYIQIVELLHISFYFAIASDHLLDHAVRLIIRVRVIRKKLRQED